MSPGPTRSTSTSGRSVSTPSPAGLATCLWSTHSFAWTPCSSKIKCLCSARSTKTWRGHETDGQNGQKGWEALKSGLVAFWIEKWTNQRWTVKMGYSRLCGMWTKWQCGPFVTWTTRQTLVDCSGLHTYKYEEDRAYKSLKRASPISMSLVRQWGRKFRGLERVPVFRPFTERGQSLLDRKNTERA